MTKKIGLGQAIILLFLCRIFNILNYIPTFSKKVDFAASLIGIVISTILNFALIIPAVMLLKKHEGQSIFQIAFQKEKRIGYLVAFIYLFFLFMNLLNTVLGFHYFITTAIFPNAASFIVIISFCIVCFACAHYGLEGLARTATIIFVLFLAVIYFIGITSIQNFNWFNLISTFHSPFSDVFDTILLITARNAEIYLLLLLAPFIKGNISKGFGWYIIATGIIHFLLNFLIIGVLGEYAYSQTIPFFTLATISETKVLQRLDSIYMVVWVFMSFIKITTYIILIAQNCKEILPKRFSKYTIFTLFVFTTIIATLLTNFPELVQKYSSFGEFITILLLVIIPLFLLPIKHRKGETSCEKTTHPIADHTV